LKLLVEVARTVRAVYQEKGHPDESEVILPIFPVWSVTGTYTFLFTISPVSLSKTIPLEGAREPEMVLIHEKPALLFWHSNDISTHLSVRN
jgi:hypothetical protein